MQSENDIIQQLDQSYSKIRKKQIFGALVQGGPTVLVVAILFDAMVILGSLAPKISIVNLIISSVLFIMFVAAIIMLKKNTDRFKIDNHLIIFKRFYTFYKDLSDGDLSKKNIKKKKNTIEFFARGIKYWAYPSAPTAIHELPQSIYDNLKEHVVKIFENNDTNKIKAIQKYFLWICYDLNQHDFTLDEWVEFSNNLEKISTGKEPVAKKPRSSLIIKEHVTAPASNEIQILRLISKNPFIYGLALFVALTGLGIASSKTIDLTIIYQVARDNITAPIILGVGLKSTQMVVNLRFGKS